MAKIIATYQASYAREPSPCSIEQAIAGSVGDYASSDDQLSRLSERLTKLTEIVGVLAEYAVRSGDEQLGRALDMAMSHRYAIEVE